MSRQPAVSVVRQLLGVPVARHADNTLRVRTVPVVFVPGFMGSRLVVTHGGSWAWDPDAGPAWPAGFDRTAAWREADRATLAERFRADVPARLAGPDDAASVALEPHELGRGWEQVVWSQAGAMLRSLEEHAMAGGFGSARCPVHVAGWDWRQSVAAVAPMLAERWRAIMAASRATTMILVTHGSGGLAARAALRAHPDLVDRTLAVVHLAQPAGGSPAMLRRLLAGVTTAEVAAAAAATATPAAATDPAPAEAGDGGPAPSAGPWRVLGDLPAADVRRLCAGWPGAVELLPTAAYRAATDTPVAGDSTSSSNSGPGSAAGASGPPLAPAAPVAPGAWLAWRSGEPGAVAQASAGDLFERWAAGGIAVSPIVAGEPWAAELRRGLLEASAMHRSLGDWMHPWTASIAGTGRATDFTLSATRDTPAPAAFGAAAPPPGLGATATPPGSGLPAAGPLRVTTGRRRMQAGSLVGADVAGLGAGDGEVPIESATALRPGRARLIGEAPLDPNDPDRQFVLPDAPEHHRFAADERVIAHVRTLISAVLRDRAPVANASPGSAGGAVPQSAAPRPSDLAAEVRFGAGDPGEGRNFREPAPVAAGSGLSSSAGSPPMPAAASSRSPETRP